MSTTDLPPAVPTSTWPDVLSRLLRGLLIGGAGGFLTGSVALMVTEYSKSSSANDSASWVLTILLTPVLIGVGGGVGLIIGASLGVMVAALLVILRMDARQRRSWHWYVLHSALWTAVMAGLVLAVPEYECLFIVSIFAPSMAEQIKENSIRSPSQDQYLHCIWGTGSNLILGGSHAWHRDGKLWKRSREFQHSIKAMWGTDPTDVWAARLAGKLAHFDGQAWTEVPSGVEPTNLNAVWGSGPADVWAIGQNLTIIHYNGQDWTRSGPSDGGDSLEGIWGSARADVWAVGFGGTILHFDGQSWTRIDRKNDYAALNAVWGSGRSDIWAGGDSGRVLHYDGKSWNLVHGGPGYTSGIWGSSPSDVWFVGDGRTIWHYDGLSFAARPSDADQDLRGIWGSGPSDIWAIGEYGQVLHYDGAAWKKDESLSRKPRS